MDVYGSRRIFLLKVTEPVPGRVLVEEDVAAGALTRFTLDPLDGGRTRVTIASDFRTAGGLRGFFEQLMNPAITRRIYREELAILEQVARQRAAQGGAGYG
jgi:hypothetical protein